MKNLSKLFNCCFISTLTFLLTWSNPYHLSAQCPWEELTGINEGLRMLVGFSIDDKGYLGTGQTDDGDSQKSFWEYDPATDTWTQLADFGGEERRRAVSFATDGKGYIGLGQSQSNDFLDDFWTYDPTTNTWTEIASFGGGERRSAVGFEINGKGYVGTGWDGSRNNDFWEYDPVSDEWIQKAGFPGTAREVATGFALNGKGYIGTGFIGGGNFTDDFWSYDPVTDEWTQIADFPGGARVIAVGFAIGDKGYVGTGQTGSGSTSDPSDYNKDLWSYDPLTDNWEVQALFCGPARGWGTAFSINGIGYFGAGELGDGTYQGDFWSFEPNAPLCITAQTSSTDASSIGCDGTATVTPVGGDGPYEYFWSDPLNQTDSIATGLCDGIYRVTVTDLTGCGVIVDSVVIETTTSVSTLDKQEDLITVYPNPAQDHVVIACEQADYKCKRAEGAIFSLKGGLIKTFSLNESGTQLELTNFTSGVYIVQIRTGNGVFNKKLIVE